jgi:hypothetical protein
MPCTGPTVAPRALQRSGEPQLRHLVVPLESLLVRTPDSGERTSCRAQGGLPTAGNPTSSHRPAPAFPSAQCRGQPSSTARSRVPACRCAPYCLDGAYVRPAYRSPSQSPDVRMIRKTSDVVPGLIRTEFVQHKERVNVRYDRMCRLRG